jgi:MoaA/NifB/PqqE/SkfB family radical SAM enzyme/polysaccharide pyruvyl transferase WcaK-like protein
MVPFNREIVQLLLLMAENGVKKVFERDIVKPRVVNYSATNKCNFRCVMCNVWRPEHSAKKEMTPEDIQRVFSKPLFSRVEHVGVSGGEPLMRKDIRGVFGAIAGSLPGLKGMSIITNGSIPGTVDVVSGIKEDLSKRGMPLDVEVSLDGINNIHDLNRGVKGAYERTLKTIEGLASKGLISRLSTTITRENARFLFQTYAFAKERGIRIDFRLASLINRLFNNDLYANFRLSDAERLMAIKFLENIIHYYEREGLFKRLFYTSLIGALKGGQRAWGCDYRTSYGVSLDPFGDIFFCFPKSRAIANINNAVDSGIRLLKENRERLAETHKFCPSCTHDYFGVPDIRTLGNFLYTAYYKDWLNIMGNTRALKEKMPEACKRPSAIAKAKRLSILGWYGTETLGDKFILAGIIENLLKEGFLLKDITIISLHPTYTELTLLELGLEGVAVVDAYNAKNDLSFIGSQDAFVFGGGPLCDIEPMIDVLTIFKNAKRLGKKTLIYGAGIGPLKEKRYVGALNKMLECTDRYSFRDSLCVRKYMGSVPMLQDAGEGCSFIDPATNYIRKNRGLGGGGPDIGRYALFSFRDWLFMYADGLTREEFCDKNRRYEDQMQALVEKTVSMGMKAVFFPMSTFYIGGDDREYYLNFMKRFKDAKDIILVDHEYAPSEALQYFRGAEFSVCLRFHSVVSSVVMNTPLIALEYHYGGGKISGFMSGLGLMDRVYSFDAFGGARPETLIERAQERNIDWPRVNSVIDERNNSLFNYMRINGHN